MNWRKVKKRTIVVTTMLCLFFGVLLYFIFVPRPVSVEATKVITGPLQEIIRADGVLRSKDRLTVTSFADGDIKRVSLKVGDSLKKGEKFTELYWDFKYDAVVAPIKGVVSKVYRESAGPIRRGEPIIEIVDPSKLEVMAELLTTDAVRLQNGADAWIENWSGAKPIAARVTRVSKAGFTKQSALGVEEERTEVTADLISPSASLLDNVGNTFHVDITFKVNEFTNALKVPVGALFRDGTDWAVFVEESGRARKRKVEIDAIGAQEAAIKSGLTFGEIVLIYPGDLVKDGTRLRLQMD